MLIPKLFHRLGSVGTIALALRSARCKAFLLLVMIFSFVQDRSFARVPESSNSLSLKEKIGQLFVIPAGELLGDSHLDDVKRLIIQDKIGGVLLKQGTIEGQSAFISRLQGCSEIPLLCLLIS